MVSDDSSPLNQLRHRSSRLGDEYAVIWDPDLVPQTENFEPYDYDSQDEPVPLDRPVERDDINEIVLDIASQNLTGDMSNLHLALADALDTCHPEVLQLAGYISQELDAPKTGKHPVTSEDLHRYRQELLRDGYPDFMMKETAKSYPSKKILGKCGSFEGLSLSLFSNAHWTFQGNCSARLVELMLVGIKLHERTAVYAILKQCKSKLHRLTKLLLVKRIVNCQIPFLSANRRCPSTKRSIIRKRQNIKDGLKIFSMSIEKVY